jgi:hypothetical protein
MDGDDKTPHDAATDDAVSTTPRDPWPDRQHAIKERSSSKNDCASFLALQLPGGRSGVKGPDERQKTAPLTPPRPPTLSLALDKSDAVRDVKPPNLW